LIYFNAKNTERKMLERTQFWICFYCYERTFVM